MHQIITPPIPCSKSIQSYLFLARNSKSHQWLIGVPKLLFFSVRLFHEIRHSLVALNFVSIWCWVVTQHYLDFKHIRQTSIWDSVEFFNVSWLMMTLTRDSFLLILGGVVFDRTGSHSKLYDFSVPLTNPITLFSFTSILSIC